MTTPEDIYGLIEAAHVQQEAIAAELEGLQVEREALTQAISSLREATAKAIPVLQLTVATQVGKSLAGASQAAGEAAGAATQPLIESIRDAVRTVSVAEGSIQRAAQWFAWKWVAVAGGGLVGVCLVAYASLAWQLHQVDSLMRQKAELGADVDQLQATVSALEKKGGRIVMSTCGGRLCIEASSNQGVGAEKWHAGHWHSKENGVSFVIPNGY